MNTDSGLVSNLDPNSPIWNELYNQLRKIAAQQMRRESSSNLLQTTAVVHEAFLRMKDSPAAEDRSHFLAAASVAMRRVLIDEARKRNCVKRGGRQNNVSLDESNLALGKSQFVATELHAALVALSEVSEQEAKIIEMITFGGLTGEEVAKILGISASTVDRRIRAAKAWLRRELSK